MVCVVQNKTHITQIIGGIAYSNIQYGSGSGPIYLIDVLCTGSETSLLQCNSDPIHSSGCTHSEDAGVKCEGKARRTGIQGTMRLFQ